MVIIQDSCVELDLQGPETTITKKLKQHGCTIQYITEILTLSHAK